MMTRIVLVGAMMCAGLGPLAACDSSTGDKACNLPVTLNPTSVKPGETLHVAITKPGCFDKMSEEKQHRMGIDFPNAIRKYAPQIPITFVNGKFTHDFAIPKTAQPGKANLAIPYQCGDNESCAAQEVPFTIVK